MVVAALWPLDGTLLGTFQPNIGMDFMTYQIVLVKHQVSLLCALANRVCDRVETLVGSVSDELCRDLR